MTKIAGITSQSVANGTRKFVSNLGRGDALLPIIMLEAFVTGGRTYHAYQRGGFVEARERGTEETLGAIFWLGGVKAFNKMGDAIGKKVLGLESTDFEVGKDAVRNPIKNYIKKFSKYGPKTLGVFKLAKVTSSILLANAVIGFIVPKINQSITKKYAKNVEQIDKSKAAQKNYAGDLNSFVNNAPEKTIEKTAGKDKKNTSFKGLGVQNMLFLANSFENDARYILLSTDVGIAGGRAVNARNKYERREILFRDLSSVYFYMFCRSHLSSLLNLMQSGRATRLDTVSAKSLDTHLQENLKSKQAYSVEEFERLVLGDQNAEVPKKVQSKIENGIITLDDLKEIVDVRTNPEIFERAKKMSKLQPELEGKAILTAEQLKDVYSNGLIDNPKLLNEVFEAYTNKKSTNPFMFVAEKDLRGLKAQMTDYVQDIIKKAKANGENITMDTLKKANQKNFSRNALNLGAGFAVSAYFLSTAIPKMQYWLTRRQTGADKFPGVEEYKK